MVADKIKAGSQLTLRWRVSWMTQVSPVQSQGHLNGEQKSQDERTDTRRKTKLDFTIVGHGREP